MAGSGNAAGVPAGIELPADGAAIVQSATPRAPSYRPNVRTRKTAICARVTGLPGQ